MQLFTTVLLGFEFESLTQTFSLTSQHRYCELEKIAHCQYFCFRSTVSGLTDKQNVKYSIVNAGEASFPTAWPGTTVCFTEHLHEPEAWKRQTDTTYQEGKLSWTHEHVSNGSVFFAFYPLFSYERHMKLVSKCSLYANVESLGQTKEGREIDLVQVGSGERVCWVFHRQHPGETMSEWFAEGFLTRLLGLNTAGEVDGLTHQIRQLYTFYIVPCMCPDGVVHGHLRTNSVGANLNREWTSKGEPGDADYYQAPTLERSPEVYYVLKKMEETGVDVSLDIHGDEELPFNFIAGATGAPAWGPRLESLHGAFLASYGRANADMQSKIGYDPDPPMQGNLGIAKNQIANRFDCLSMTLEMPYKDCRTDSDPERGWSPHNSYMLGASLLDPLLYVHPYLRAQGEFWKNFRKDDAYIHPTCNYSNTTTP